MRKLFVVSVAIVIVAMAGAASAIDTATVTVSATVAPTCRFSSPAAALAFGVLPDPAADTNASTTLNFWCTTGASYTITDDDGLYETGLNANRMRSTALAIPQYMPYTFSYAPASGTGLGPATPINLNITGTVLAASYSALPGDVYQDSVVLTINP